MKYTVRFTEQAKKDLKKLDKHTAALILGWVRKNLEGCENPRLHGKGLTANRSGEWRYRVGSYRLLAKIEKDAITILTQKLHCVLPPPRSGEARARAITQVKLGR